MGDEVDGELPFEVSGHGMYVGPCTEYVGPDKV